MTDIPFFSGGKAAGAELISGADTLATGGERGFTGAETAGTIAGAGAGTGATALTTGVGTGAAAGAGLIAAGFAVATGANFTAGFVSTGLGSEGFGVAATFAITGAG